jgi:hypothetical protein
MENITFSKQELIERLVWVNNFRFLLGLFFFISFSVLLFFRLFVDPGYEAALIAGLFLFSYSFLVRYYLNSQKTISLGEVIFLSIFLAVMDMTITCSFVYFTGAAESPNFVLLFLNLISVIMTFPYFLQAVFVAAATASLGYEFILWSHLNGYRPFLQGLTPGSERSHEVMERLTLIHALTIPVLLFIVAAVAFFLSRHIISIRKRFDKILIDEGQSQAEITSLSNISWILTRVTDLNYMLERVLEEVFKILGVSSGGIFIISSKTGYFQKKASIGLPTPLITYLAKLKPGTLPNEKDATLKKMIADEKITEMLAKSILAPKEVQMGYIVLFSRGEEQFSKRGIVILDSIVAELSIALGYACFLEKVKGMGRKKEDEAKGSG